MSLLNIKDPHLREIVEPLLNLRNKCLNDFLTKSSKIDWSIKNKNVLNILNKIGYKKIWTQKNYL